MSVPDLSCPAPTASDVVEMLHGAGGRQTQALIRTIFREAFDGANAGFSPNVDGLSNDGAVFELPRGEGALSVSTDAYVVQPVFFPGGDIGSIAVTGTLNDLAMVGARAHAITASFVLEEGFPLDDLRRIVASMAAVAKALNVPIVAGDTKVVQRGHGDGVYITTTGIGLRSPGIDWQPSRVLPGDVIIVSGDLGRHGIAVLSAREGLGLSGLPGSDCELLWPLVSRLLPLGESVACLRDLTRGGLGSALDELATASGTQLELDEGSIPVSEPVRAACELLGLEPLFVANEGRCVAIVRPDVAELVLDIFRRFASGEQARNVGRVVAGSGRVVLNTAMGTQRSLDWGAVGQLPRIC